jgi:Tfp pilus assembly protein PilN
MKQVRIDFAPRSLGRALFRGPRPALSLLVAALALAPLLASNVAQYRRLLQDQDAAQAKVASTRARAAARVPLPAPARVPEAQAGAVNAAVLQLNLPWRALHDVVQASTPASIALLALEPDAKRRNLRITAEARSSDDMLAYVRQLGQQDWFSAVALARHEINEQDPNRPIRFQVDAEWRAAP